MTKRRSVARSDDGRGMDATCVSLLSQSPSPAPLPLARPLARSLAWVLPSSLLPFSSSSSPLPLHYNDIFGGAICSRRGNYIEWWDVLGKPEVWQCYSDRVLH